MSFFKLNTIEIQEIIRLYTVEKKSSREIGLIYKVDKSTNRGEML